MNLQSQYDLAMTDREHGQRSLPRSKPHKLVWAARRPIAAPGKESEWLEARSRRKPAPSPSIWWRRCSSMIARSDPSLGNQHGQAVTISPLAPATPVQRRPNSLSMSTSFSST
jgi:hypothetical protein